MINFGNSQVYSPAFPPALSLSLSIQTRTSNKYKSQVARHK